MNSGYPTHSGRRRKITKEIAAELDRQFIARLKHLDLPELEGLLSSVPNEWQWVAVQRQIAKRKA